MLGEPSQTESNLSSSPALTLILCSRNDQYMGNSRWRLETALNYAAKAMHEIGRANDVEILVTDWGSEAPLHETLQLSPVAASMVSFIVVPPAIAYLLQQDSPFPEVLALNAAARRAKGNYIGRIDQDTLVGRRFLEFFFELYDAKRQLEVPLEKAQMFANTRIVPYRFASRSPAFPVVEQFIRWFSHTLTMEHRNSWSDFYTAGVGIWLLHRNLWQDSGGYDERMIYMNGMETNMVRRLLPRYELVNLGKLVNYDFYHLEHYHPGTVRKSSTYRKVNSKFAYSQPDELHPNAQSWGLAEYDLPLFAASVCKQGKGHESRSLIPGALALLLVVLRIGPELGIDSLRTVCARWRRRVDIVWQTVNREPVFRWPHLLRKRWIERKLSQRSQPTQ
jgi:hypothetical protein